MTHALSISTDPPTSGPLRVHFSGDTPLVEGSSIVVRVFTTRPATAVCRLGQTGTMSCKLLHCTLNVTQVLRLGPIYLHYTENVLKYVSECMEKATLKWSF